MEVVGRDQGTVGRLHSISQLCNRPWGRQHFYDIKQAFEEGGIEALRERTVASRIRGTGRRRMCYGDRLTAIGGVLSS
jgi:hypothetical protein